MAIKRNDDAAIWLNLKNTMLSLKSHSHKGPHVCGFISMKCDWLCVPGPQQRAAGCSVLPVSEQLPLHRQPHVAGRQSVIVLQDLLLCPTPSPTSQSSPKPSGCPRIPPPQPLARRLHAAGPQLLLHGSLPRVWELSPCLEPYLLPLHSTPGESGRGGAA